jgi:hypothetical protein
MTNYVTVRSHKTLFANTNHYAALYSGSKNTYKLQANSETNLYKQNRNL